MPQNNKKKITRVAVSLIKFSLLITVLAYVAVSLYDAAGNVDWETLSFSPGHFISGACLIAGSVLAGVRVHCFLYGALGSRLSSMQAFILLTVPQAGKYLPSKFLSLAGHTAIARSFGIRIVLSGAVTLLLMGLGLASATLIGSVLLLFQTTGDGGTLFRFGTVSMLFLVTCLILHPDIYWRMMNVALGLFKQRPLKVKVSLRTMAVLFGLLVLQNGLFLGGISVMTTGMVQLSASKLPALVGATCLANVAGFLALFAPAGIGVREGILFAMLTPLSGAGVASLIVVMMRFSQTAVDLLLILTGLAALNIWNRRNKETPVSREKPDHPASNKTVDRI